MGLKYSEEKRIEFRSDTLVEGGWTWAVYVGQSDTLLSNEYIRFID